MVDYLDIILPPLTVVSNIFIRIGTYPKVFIGTVYDRLQRGKKGQKENEKNDIYTQNQESAEIYWIGDEKGGLREFDTHEISRLKS